jgi:hypothetical protein
MKPAGKPVRIIAAGPYTKYDAELTKYWLDRDGSSMKHSMNAKLIFSLSWLAAVTLAASPVNAAPRRGGGGHGHGHMSMPSRGGATFSRGGNRSGRNWSGRNWSGGNWSGGNQFIFTGGYGSPFFYGYPSYGYYPYGYYGNQGYGYGNGNQGYRHGNQRQEQKGQMRERSRRDQTGR